MTALSIAATQGMRKLLSSVSRRWSALAPRNLDRGCQRVAQHTSGEIARSGLAVSEDYQVTLSSQSHRLFSDGRQQPPPGLTIDDASGLTGTNRRALPPASEQSTNGRLNARLEFDE